MPTVWLAVGSNGEITAGGTTPPQLVEGDEKPNYQYQFDLTWEQIEELWKYKVVDGQLVLK
jgi:hypothetical protein